MCEPGWVYDKFDDKCECTEIGGEIDPKTHECKFPGVCSLSSPPPGPTATYAKSTSSATSTTGIECY